MTSAPLAPDRLLLVAPATASWSADVVQVATVAEAAEQLERWTPTSIVLETGPGWEWDATVLRSLAPEVPIVLVADAAASPLVTLDRSHVQTEARFEALVQNVSDVIALHAADGRLLYLSPSAGRLLGYEGDAGELVGFTVDEYVHPDDLPLLATTFAAWATDEGVGDAVEYRVRSNDGQWRIFESIGVNLLHDPAVAGVVVTTRDVTERRRVEEQLEHRALHDPLTELPNRALFRDRLSQATARTERTASSAAVFFIDVDRFKTINDSLGHQVGDEVLVAVGHLLAAAVRPGDTVARLGGDEFAVCCEDVDDEDAALLLADRLQRVLRLPFRIAGRELFVTVSIGIALSPPGRAADPDALLRQADTALYRAKERGRDRFELFDHAAREAGVDHFELENSLRRALDRNELTVHFQPEIRVEDGAVVGVEALVRWEHPEHGLLPPAAFIPLAEETGLIVPIGAWVLRHACREVVTWNTGVAAGRPLLLSVNLSARQLAQPDLVDVVAAALADTGLPPELLCLEITESVLMSDSNATVQTLEELKELGVQLAVDDFGTGYSSLLYLKRFPVDILKVDRSFVDGLGRDPEDSTIVAAVVRLAHSLGLQAIAEGVETPEQLAALRPVACDWAQGYHWARPLPARDLTAWLSARASDARLAPPAPVLR